MMDGNILVYHNITGIAEVMRPLMVNENIRADVAGNVEVLLKKLREENFHMILIDADLTEEKESGGAEVIRYLRSHTMLPIIVVSERKEGEAQIRALEAGADDYMAVEEHPLVLMARVKSHLKRYFQIIDRGTAEERRTVYKAGNIEIDDNCHKVTVEGRNVKMTPIEYKILRLLIKEQGKVLSIDQIYESIWKMNAVRVDNTIAVHIRHIREKIEANPRKPCYLKAVRGMGYKVG